MSTEEEFEKLQGKIRDGQPAQILLATLAVRRDVVVESMANLITKIVKREFNAEWLQEYSDYAIELEELNASLMEIAQVATVEYIRNTINKNKENGGDIFAEMLGHKFEQEVETEEVAPAGHDGIKSVVPFANWLPTEGAE